MPKRIFTQINKFISIIKIVIPLLPGYIYNTLKQFMRIMPKNNHNILFTFDEENIFGEAGNFGREAYYAMKGFSDGGYNVYFYRKHNLKNYYRLNFLGRQIFKIRNLKLISRLPSNTKDYIYCFDSIRKDLLSHEWRRLIYINIRKDFSFHLGNVIQMPFYMFPLVYSNRLDEKLEIYRKAKRKLKVFFGGNIDSTYYNDEAFKQCYPGQLTRLEGVNAVLESGHNVQLINDYKIINAAFKKNSYLNKFIILKTNFPFKITPVNWMALLSRCDFFMCFSGAAYPMCHNAIETMAVGSIPILSYAHWFDPPLEHGRNAIIFSGRNDLINKIKYVLQIPQEKILNLRRSVIEYYNDYLANGCLVSKFEKHAEAITTLMLFPKAIWGLNEEAESTIFKNEFLSALLKKSYHD